MNQKCSDVPDLAAPRSLPVEQMKRLAHLSHEIRTPLNSILALSQLLRDGMAGTLNVEQKKYVEVIERNGQNLIRLVNNVLDLSRMAAGHIDVELRSLDLGDQLRATAAALAPLAEVKGIELVVDAVPRLPLVRCDPDRVRQVLTNLIGNAIKFTDRGEVKISAARSGDMVAVHVSDTGIGIPEAARTRLFEEFFQAGESDARRNGGAGLGLAIASRLVQLMDGELSVESAEGVGSRFTFTLPVGERTPVPDRVEAVAREARASTSLEPGAPRSFPDEHHGTHTAD